MDILNWVMITSVRIAQDKKWKKKFAEKGAEPYFFPQTAIQA
jgi:hypothetical protein